ncbi:hypothetical protein GGR52DRAFT_347131 [Hypoxylon sp. FL1284]|nr:hypothetical protein GGR52DRAFT_347131 [Hypoxylon sp. FL1284]
MKKVRFPGDEAGSYLKRKQVKKACDTCRQSKRRCHHVLGSGALPHHERNAAEVPAPAADTALEGLDDDRISNHQIQEAPGSCGAREEPTSSPPCSTATVAPFAGPTSAHSLLLSVCASTNMADPSLETDPARGLPSSRLLRPSFQDLKAPPSERRPGVDPGYLPFLVRAILPYLEIECMQMLPPPEDLDALIKIFRREVHPVLPIVDFGTRSLAGPVDRDEPATVILRQAICLAVCKNSSARAHLRLPADETGRRHAAHGPREFANKLFGVLKVALDIGLVDDRLELVQLLALMTLHSYGPDGDDEVARLCGQAVHYAYSSGLHYPASPSATPAAEVRRVELLYSLFAVDKIVAMITGRPAIIREGDAYLPEADDAVPKALSPSLRLLFRLSQMLNQVLDLYRPRARGEASAEECVLEASWPEFEALAAEYELQTVQTSIQASLELLYHVICILSHRPPQPLAFRDYIPEGGTSVPPTQASKVRHSFSAQRIFCLLGLEATMLPFVPYAASLSLSVALRNLQQTTLESSKRLARDDVEKSLRVLKELAETYWHAESAGTTGRQILQTLS